jgi:CheY-like chemotaxis protein
MRNSVQSARPAILSLRAAPGRLTRVLRIPPRPPPVVLDVVNDPDTRELLRVCLNQVGIEAAEAANAHDALKKVSETLPHAVLLDMALPGTDGYDLCRMLRDRPDTLVVRSLARPSTAPGQ